MSDRRRNRDDERRERRRQKRKRRRQRPSRGRSRREESEERDELVLSAQEQSYEDAHRLAERKVKVAGEAIKFAVVVLVLLVVIPPVGFIVMIWWGFGLGKEVYRLLVEPRLRDTFIEREVQNQVRAELSRDRQEIEGEHARSLEELSASIAHEIRNPITAAKSLVQQMEEEPTARENVEYARVALEELHRVEKSVSHLLRFARDEAVGMEEVVMAEVVESAVETFRDRLARSGVTLERQMDCEGVMHGDAEKLRRVVINLVANALDALDEADPSDGSVHVHMGENLAGSEVWLRVKDNGPGLEREAIQKLFSPFYTSKANGTGLGLAISKKLVDAHQGTIEVSSVPGAGTEFLVTFPKVPQKEGGPA